MVGRRRRTELGLAGIVVALGVAGVAAAWTLARGGSTEGVIGMDIRYSRFIPSEVRVPVGVAVTFELHNGDPIDHEWILGDDGVHERHRSGTEPDHDARPTEVTVPAGATVRTTIVIDEAGTLAYVCHLPGHEAYGMTGRLVAGG